jgi:hypothetical protein|tara:strand:- start:5 stop:622 length:618 start_codon:yes stop_codon:yes gene_type:complete
LPLSALQGATSEGQEETKEMSATNRGTERHPGDFYETPPGAIDPLLMEQDLERPMVALEPGAGKGALSQAVHRRWGHPHPLTIAVESDPVLAKFLRGQLPCVIEDDFLTLPHFNDVGLIVCNPPFTLAQKFISTSLATYPGIRQAFLLRLNFLASQQRKDWWKDRRDPPKLRVLSKRPSFTGGGTDATDYAWFCWNWPGAAIEWL